MIEIREARYFIAVAEELHFGRAAERLHMSQPPLSQVVKALEHRLGVLLLNRTTRQVTLTPAGTVFLDRCRELVATAQAADSAARAAADGQTGQLSIGAVTSAFTAAHPTFPAGDAGAVAGWARPAGHRPGSGGGASLGLDTSHHLPRLPRSGRRVLPRRWLRPGRTAHCAIHHQSACYGRVRSRRRPGPRKRGPAACDRRPRVTGKRTMHRTLQWHSRCRLASRARSFSRSNST
jgi:hypothetical protein